MVNVDKLVEEHWKYVEGVIKAAYGRYEELSAIDISTIKEIEYHYKTAFVHGYKHAKEKFELPLFEINPTTGERRLVND